MTTYKTLVKLVALVLLLHSVLAEDTLTHTQPTIPSIDKMHSKNVGEKFQGTIAPGDFNTTLFLLNVDKPVNPDGYLFFVVNLGNNAFKKMDVVAIKTKPNDKGQVSTNAKQIINQNRTVIMKCSSYAVDQCHVPVTQLPHQEFFSLMVFLSCQGGCSFTFQSYFQAPQQLRFGDIINMNFFTEGKAEIFQLDGTNMASKDINEVRIILQPRFYNEGERNQMVYFNAPKMLANLISDRLPTQKDHDLQSWQIWNAGEGIFLTKQKFVGKKLKLLVYGVSSQNYTLSCQLIEKEEHIIPFERPFHDFIDPQQEHFYHIDFQKLLEVDPDMDSVYSLHFQIYSGGLQIGFYKDEKRTEEFEVGSFQYMGNSNYVFSKQALKDRQIKSLQAKIVSKSNQSTTFTCRFSRELQTKGIQIKEATFTFSTINQRQLFYYRYIEDGDMLYSQQLNFRVHMFTSQGGKHQPLTFRTCNANKSLADCLDLKMIDSATRIVKDVQKVLIEQNDRSQVYQVHVPQGFIDEKTFALTKPQFLIIEASTVKSQKKGFVGLFLRDTNFIRPLDLGNPIPVKVETGYDNFFIYQKPNNPKDQYSNKKIQSIEIRIFILTGKITTSVTRDDPRISFNEQIKLIDKQKGVDQIQPKQQTAGLHIYQVRSDENATNDDFGTRPIYLRVSGLARSTYVISLQGTRKGEQQEAAKNNNMDSLKIQAKKQYSFIVKASTTQIVEIKPTGKSDVIVFKVKGSQGFAICELSPITMQCKNQFPTIGNNFNFTISQADDKGSLKDKILFRIFSADLQSSVEISLNYQEGRQIQCVTKSFGKFQKEVLPSQACFEYPVTKFEAIQAIFYRIELAQLIINVTVCGNDYPIISQRFTISAQDLKNNCLKKLVSNSQGADDENSEQKSIRVTLSSYSNEKLNSMMRVVYSLQYMNDVLTLPSGIAYQSSILANQTTPLVGKFYFNLLKKVETKIIVYGINLPEDLQINAFLNDQKSKDAVQSPFNGKVFSSKKLQHTAEQYFAHKIVKLQKSQLQAQSCKENCVLVIELIVPSLKNEHKMIRQNSYTIQVFQDKLVISEYQQRHNFLLKGSIAYYRYDCSSQDQKVIFKIGNNKEECARISVGDSQFPGTPVSANDKAIYFDSTVSHEIQGECKRGRTENRVSPSLFFAVQALEDCPITANVQSTQANLRVLRSGVPADITLRKGQVEFFVFRHTSILEFDKNGSKSSFKFMSIESQGDVNIYINQTTYQTLGFLSNESDKAFYKKFSLRNNYKNSIEVSSDMKGYCDDCQYFAAVEVKSSTTDLVESTIIFLDNPTQNQAQIVMQPKKVMYDEILNQHVVPTRLKYHRALKGKVFVTVLNGRIKVSILHNSKSVKKDMEAAQKKYNLAYDFVGVGNESNRGIDSWAPITIEISNIGHNQPAVYKIYVVRDSDHEIEANFIKEGMPEFQTLIKGETQCIRGQFKNNLYHKFYISSNDPKSTMENLKAQMTVRDNPVKIKINRYQNNLEIDCVTNQQNFGQSLDYLLCLTNPDSEELPVMILQSSSLNLMLQDKWLLVNSEQNFLIHPPQSTWSKFLIDALACKGELNYYMTEEYAQLEKERSIKDLKVNKLADSKNSETNWKTQDNHIVYIQNNSSDDKERRLGISKFLYIQSNLAKVRWMMVDQKRGLGMGYQDYAAGEVQYQLVGKQLQINFQPIKPIKDNIKTQIIRASYRLIIGKDPQVVKGAANCWSDSDDVPTLQFYSKKVDYTTSDMSTMSKSPANQKSTIRINKEQIRKKYLEPARRRLLQSASTQSAQTSYIMMAADITISIPESSKEETYRFVYKSLSLPTEFLLQDYEQNQWLSFIDSHPAAFIVIVSIISLIGLVVVGYFGLRKVGPMVSRIWHSRAVDLGEEADLPGSTQNPQEKTVQKNSPIKSPQKSRRETGRSAKKQGDKSYIQQQDEQNPEKPSGSAAEFSKHDVQEI